MNKITHFSNWTDGDLLSLDKARTFKDLFVLAKSIIDRIGGDIHMVSGPISTGGVGTINGNRKVFEGIIDILVLERKLPVFSQMPFEDKMVEFYIQWHIDNPRETYCTPILSDFYEPLFISGRIKVMHFIHDWKSSFGARWEHDNCPSWNISRSYLEKVLSDQALIS